MKALVTGLLLALASIPSFAQKSPIKFGNVPLEELAMTTYAKDSSAEAVILVDFGESSIDYAQTTGFALHFERTTRIKILGKEGLDWGNFEIPLYHDGTADEKISGLKGVTYNLENGKIVESKLKSDAIFREMVNSNLELVKVSLPNVKEGSVVEITYRVVSEFLFNFQDWEFQHTIPVIWSEYRTKMPEFFNYDKYTQGYVTPTINEPTSVSGSISITSKQRSETDLVARTSFSTDKIDFRENRLRLVYQNVPAFKDEPFITTYKDYVAKINFELSHIKYPDEPVKQIMGSWQQINKQYSEDEDFGGEVTGNGFLKKTVEEITAGVNTAQEKVAAIHNYVRNSFQWDGSSRKFTSTPLRKVFENKKGNSAEINLLLASMLEKAGFKVSPVLLSTRDHGFIRETIAISSQFNYTICLVQVDDKQILLDATDKFLPTGALPERTLNGKGFVVSKEGFKWVSLSAPSKSKTSVTADLKLTDNEFIGSLKFERLGYDAQVSRKRYVSKGEADYFKDLKEQFSMELNKSEVQNLKELQESFKELHEVVLRDQVTATAEMIYFNPLLNMRLESSPFKSEKREYPVDYGSGFDKVFFAKFTIPEGYAIEEIPKSKVLMLPNNSAKYVYNVSTVGNIISITSNFQINKGLFTQDEYPNLREFYNQVVAKQAEQIVLKKK